MRLMRPAAIFLLLVALAVAVAVVRPVATAQQTSAAPPVVGSARSAVVFDGDSFDFEGRHFQLAGIDAPELGQRCVQEARPRETCGLAAAYELRKRLQLDPRPLRCWPQSETADGAIVATCAAAEDDLALVLVESGYAFAQPQAQIDYRLAEEKARTGGIGLWSNSAVAPWDWRAAKARAGARTPEEGCVIAGIVEADGKRVYFGPLDHGYGAKRVDPSRGERWFCGEEDARAAGWRRPGETLRP